MPETSDNLNKAKNAWRQVRSFASLWLALICLAGFVVLVSGPWVVGVLQRLFGPAGAAPRGVIAIDLLATLPFAVYLWIQQRKLDEDKRTCPECGAEFPKTQAACPKCGSASADKANPVTPSP